ncbi:hypothetical protein FRX31_011914 [Thalictrum thalictroides]|uniref:BAG domain-containing protein n=1 Tax=Thalictrum thalictroides TaxID=46969 RepID=A0A7J6WPI9_THATH|nr:hypothetical protein FRX31_011914 [Thalictrum thalictroides]
MLPVFKGMEQQPHPYPYPQTSHIPYFPSNYYPNWEVNPQLKPDFIKSPAAYEPWSYGSGFGYPNRMECHGCCNHMYHPPSYYTVRPPLHSHLPAPSPFYYHGPYPPYAEAYPPYHAPHLYPMQQPRYEYDKDMHGRRCCGCPNHVSDKKEDKGVKIEEFEPEIGKEDSDSLGLAKGASNWSYPFLLVPPDYLKKNGDLKSLAIDPKLLNGRYPFGIRNDSESGKSSESESKDRLFLPEVKDDKSLHPVVDDKATQNSSMEDRRAQFPFPVFWSPNYEKEEQKNEDGKDIDANTSPKIMEEQPEKLKIIPLNFSGNDNNVMTPVEDKCGNKGDEKKAEKNVVKVRNIPVQQIDDRGEKNAAESKITFKEVHVEQKRENEKKPSGNDEKSQSSSPRKASKLPPVCLRVDPLPRRKTVKGTSRSPSPPAGKTQVNQNTSNSVQPTVQSKECPGQAEQVYLQKKSEEEKPGHGMKVDHSGETLNHCKEELSRNYDEPHSKTTVDVFNKEASLISSSDERDLCKRENESAGDGETVAVMEIMEKAKEKKDLSTTEAALLIQSFYRGFEVRKWKPLEKLKLIAKIREQVNAVREQIHVLESSTEVQNDEKRRVLVAETIMSLLLQLDAIQGLHPSIRERRKAVARELVSMQEKLDSFVKESRREENNPEPRNTSDASLQDAICETELQKGCVPTEPTYQPKEAEDPYTVESQLPADGGVEESIVEPSDSKFETVSHSKLTKDEALSLKERGDAEKLDETLALHTEFAKIPMPADKKEDYEMEELPELLMRKKICESEGNQCNRQSIDVDDAPSFTAENEEILLGKDEDAITQDDVYEKSSLEDCTSQSTVDGSAPLDSKDQELGSGKDKNDVQDLCSQGQPAACPSAEEKCVEDASAHHENNVNSCDEDVFSENLPGIVLLSQESMQRSDDESKDDGSNSPQEGTKVPDVIPSLSERVENLCLDMKANQTKEDGRESKSTVDVQEVPVQEVPVNEEVAVKDHERGGAEDKMLKEENEKLREMIEKLIQEGRQQLTVISDLNGKVNNLERKLTKKKKVRGRRALPKGKRCGV